MRCAVCGVELAAQTVGRPRTTCSAACKQEAYRRRRAQTVAPQQFEQQLYGLAAALQRLSRSAVCTDDARKQLDAAVALVYTAAAEVNPPKLIP